MFIGLRVAHLDLLAARLRVLTDLLLWQLGFLIHFLQQLGLLIYLLMKQLGRSIRLHAELRSRSLHIVSVIASFSFGSPHLTVFTLSSLRNDD